MSSQLIVRIAARRPSGVCIWCVCKVSCFPRVYAGAAKDRSPKWSAAKDTLHMIILIVQALHIPSDSRQAREKIQQTHEDVCQDQERGPPFLIRFNQYVDISGIYDTEYQHYLQQTINGTEHPKMRVSAAEDFTEEAEQQINTLGRALTREEVERLLLARDALLVNNASRKEIDEGHLPHDTREKIYRPQPATAARRTHSSTRWLGSTSHGPGAPQRYQSKGEAVGSEGRRKGREAGSGISTRHGVH